mgnify:CR=1 FL=1
MAFNPHIVPRFLPPTGDPFVHRDGERAIAVMMSGGVDSSVTALLLQEAGWNVVGVTLKIPVLGGCSLRPCCGIEAVTIARQLGIPHYFIDVEDAFKDRVVEPFRAAYAAGRTPSPCVDCNTFIKFGDVWDLLEREFGIAHLATGHYARIAEEGTPGARLRRGEDVSRDQSYFLYGIPARRLPYLHFPLGQYSKAEARELAKERALPVADKPDSMELCFAGEGDYRQVLADVPARPGVICDKTGTELGRHSGIQNYTLGQRRGLGIAHSEPLYVIDIQPETNTVVVGPQREAWVDTVNAEAINVLAPERLQEGAMVWGKVRSVGEPHSCCVTRLTSEGVTVKFCSPVLTPAPGQHLVLYSEDGTVVAGGTIEGCSGCSANASS